MRKNYQDRIKDIGNDFWKIYKEKNFYRSNAVIAKVVGIYFAVGCLFIILLDRVLYSSINNVTMLRNMYTIRGCLFVLLTTFVLFFGIKSSVKRNEFLVRKLVESYEDLEATNEELVAAEEELRGQYKVLQSNKENMYKLAYYDSLTGMPNRTLFLNNLQTQVSKSTSCGMRGALIFIDLDNFKDINDTLGHNIGDEILKAVGNVLKERVACYGTVYRSGGDEFSIIVPSIEDLEDVQDICNKILLDFSENFNVGNNQIYATSSLGVTLFPDDGSNVNVLMKNADISMYKSKMEGKNRFTFFDEKIYNAMVRRALIEHKLREAIKEEELFVNYQPIVDSRTGKLRGMEALIRWINKELGFVSPGEFISIAEDVGLIIPIGYWIFERVAEQITEWKSKGYDIEMASVNVSSIQIRQPDFVETLKSILEKTKCKGEWINIEITEGTLIAMTEQNLRVFNEIRELGMTMSLDDFGTGYSSLNYLKNIHFDILKIDKSLIDDMHINSNSRDIVDGIIQLAHKINLEVNAEGVELEEQVEALRDIECDMIQGYYFSKPLMVDDFEKILRDKCGVLV
ncbi:putative bifunctional diguanylate cyclase/phosphodiesterase [Clostridium omnivorum]|uniref:EAL domain-containing protein n=1 Tax=Clostridium omnivorum TaxID=1604902 RepID=A0ABQ5N3B1_9CLOT|nr:bifunctional diguanylate cyclase/phosphodiesterase [Clostridium sp. E14]GLC29646.1 hypothetical protein bsdE14_10560 [Clostridium sp. E14]